MRKLLVGLVMALAVTSGTVGAASANEGQNEDAPNCERGLLFSSVGPGGFAGTGAANRSGNATSELTEQVARCKAGNTDD